MSTSPDARMGAAMSKLNWLAAPCVTCPLIILRRSNATGRASSASSQWISHSCRRVACGSGASFRRSAPIRITIADNQIQVMKPMTAPKDP